MGKSFEVKLNVPIAVSLDVTEQNKSFDAEGLPNQHKLYGTFTYDGFSPNETFSSSHEVSVENETMDPTDIPSNIQDVFTAFGMLASASATNRIGCERQKIIERVAGRTRTAFVAGALSAGAVVGGAWLATETHNYAQVTFLTVSFLGGAGLLMSHKYFTDNVEGDVLQGTIYIEQLRTPQVLLRLMLDRGTITNVSEAQHPRLHAPLSGGSEM